MEAIETAACSADAGISGWIPTASRQGRSTRNSGIGSSQLPNHPPGHTRFFKTLHSAPTQPPLEPMVRLLRSDFLSNNGSAPSGYALGFGFQ
jgi:hypothetical protein